MKIINLINEISEKYPNVLIGDLSNKPKEFHKEINDFLIDHKFLVHDTDYKDYLTKVSALSYFDESTDEDFTLFGFEGSKTITFLDNEFDNEPLIDKNGFMLFGHLIKPKENEVNDFYFESKNLDTKIYLVRNEIKGKKTKKYKLLAGCFLNFLDLIKENKV